MSSFYSIRINLKKLCAVAREELYAFTSLCFNCCNCARMEPSYTVEPMRTMAPPNSVASWW
jgi:hypothetical protein